MTDTAALIGTTVVRLDDDRPCPLIGEITGREDDDRVLVLWGDARFGDDPYAAVVEFMDELQVRPAGWAATVELGERRFTELPLVTDPSLDASTPTSVSHTTSAGWTS